MSLQEEQLYQLRYNTELEKAEFNLISILKPRIFIANNRWCVLYGESIDNGVVGFGASPIAAVYDFNKSWHQKLQINSQ